jgi:hypothetical protein
MNEGREILCFPSALAGEKETREAICFVSPIVCTVFLIKYATGHNTWLINAKRLSTERKTISGDLRCSAHNQMEVRDPAKSNEFTQ